MNIKKIKPLFTGIITTANKYTINHSKNGVITNIPDTLKEYQTVVAIGDSVRGINVGDVVVIDPTRFVVKKHKEGSLKDGVIQDNVVIAYNFDIIKINNENHLLLQDRDIKYVIEDFEEDKEEPVIIDEKPGIIVPNTGIIV